MPRCPDLVDDADNVVGRDPAVLAAVHAGDSDVIRCDPDSPVLANFLHPLHIFPAVVAEEEDVAGFERTVRLVDVDERAAVARRRITERQGDGLMNCGLHGEPADRNPAERPRPEGSKQNCRDHDHERSDKDPT